MSGLIPDGRKGGVRETITRIAKALGADLACRHHNAGTGRSIADPTVAKIAHEAGRTPAHLLARDGVTIHAHELPRVRRGLASGWQSIHLSPGQKILRAIDSFTVKNAPFFRLLFSAHVPSYFAAMDHMLDYDFQTVAPAPPRRCALSTGCRHGSRSGWTRSSPARQNSWRPGTSVSEGPTSSSPTTSTLSRGAFTTASRYGLDVRPGRTGSGLWSRESLRD